MAGQGFHHIAIRAIDFDTTLKFYAEGLGCSVHFEFSVPGRIDRAAFLDMGDGRYIEVFGQDSTVQSEGRRRRPDEETTEGALLHFCFRIADVEAAYSRALTARRGFADRAYDRAAGRRRDRLHHGAEWRGDRIPQE